MPKSKKSESEVIKKYLHKQLIDSSDDESESQSSGSESSDYCEPKPKQTRRVGQKSKITKKPKTKQIEDKLDEETNDNEGSETEPGLNKKTKGRGRETQPSIDLNEQLMKKSAELERKYNERLSEFMNKLNLETETYKKTLSNNTKSTLDKKIGNLRSLEHDLKRSFIRF